MTATQRLEQWHAGDHRRAVTIEIGNRYGPTCWLVTLKGEKSDTFAEYESLDSLSLDDVINLALDRWESL